MLRWIFHTASSCLFPITSAKASISFLARCPHAPCVETTQGWIYLTLVCKGIMPIQLCSNSPYLRCALNCSALWRDWMFGSLWALIIPRFNSSPICFIIADESRRYIERRTLQMDSSCSMAIRFASALMKSLVHSPQALCVDATQGMNAKGIGDLLMAAW